MKLHIEDGSLNYAAKIVKIEHLYPIEGKDRIVRTTINGNDVIISKESKIGDICLYFCAGTRLSEDYCKFNNLYDQCQLNYDQSKKGYISHKRRVRAMRMAGIISDGMLMPLSSLTMILGIEPDLEVGDEFTHIDNILICDKYSVPVRNSNPGGSEPKVKKFKLGDIMIPGQFRFHHETAHIGNNITKVKDQTDILLTVTHKLHGSSCILSKVKVKKKLNWKEKIAKWLGVDVVKTTYAGIYSSGKPKSALVKGIDSHWENNGPTFYEGNNIWKQAYEDYKYALEDGISLYGELCNERIQGKYDYSKLKPEGKDYAFLIYRITRTNDSGNVDEFSWFQIQEYCKKYALNTVPVIINNIKIPQGIETVVASLSANYLEKKCQFCTNDVWAEGVCIRIENPYQVYKLKSKNFLLHEDKQLEQELPNTEEQ